MELRNVMSWAVGGILFIFMIFLTSEVSKFLGITTYIEYGETRIISYRLYDEEKDGHHTGFGSFFVLLSLFVAVRVGMAVFTKSINGGVSPLENTRWFLILECLLAYGITNQLIYFVFEIHYFLGNLLDLGCGLGICFFGYKAFKKKEEKINKAPPPNPVSTTPQSDDENELYQQAFEELENDEKVVAIWSRSFAEAGGDEQKAKALYIQHRVEILKTEIIETYNQELAEADLKETERREEAIAAEQAAHDAWINLRSEKLKTFIAFVLFCTFLCLLAAAVILGVNANSGS